MSTRGSGALPAALIALAVATALGAALVELAGNEVAVARERRAAATALAAADGCIAAVLADAPAGWDFAPLLAGPDRVAGTADDGVLATPVDCTGRATAAPGPAAPARALLTVEARNGRGRRVVLASAGREREPGAPALLWLDAAPAAGIVGGTLALDGVDAADPMAAPWAALAAPADPPALDAWVAGEAPGVVLGAGTGAPIHAPAPPLVELVARLGAVAHGGAETLVAGPPPPPTLALIDGDLIVPGALSGAGLLVVTGRLDIQGSLDFTGTVVAAGGTQIAGGATLTVAGAVWATLPVAVGGRLAISRDAGAIDAADGLLPLPRLAVLLGVRDLG